MSWILLVSSGKFIYLFGILYSGKKVEIHLWSVLCTVHIVGIDSIPQKR